jgi:uncharacterized protein YndB with AHSA1/START domain
MEMKMAESSFDYVSYIGTAPEAVWAALTSPEAMQRYFFALPFEADWKVGGQWRRYFPDGSLMGEGEILELEPPSRLVISWLHADPEKRDEGFSRCIMELAPAGDATRLTVTQSIGVANSRFIAAVTDAWPQVISNLKSFLEVGAPALTSPVRN